MISVNAISFEDATLEKLLSSTFSNLQNQLFSIWDCYSLSSPNAEKPLCFNKKFFHSTVSFRGLLQLWGTKKLAVLEKKQNNIHNNFRDLSIAGKAETKRDIRAELCCEMVILKQRKENLDFCSEQHVIIYQDGT